MVQKKQKQIITKPKTKTLDDLIQEKKSMDVKTSESKTPDYNAEMKKHKLKSLILSNVSGILANVTKNLNVSNNLVEKELSQEELPRSVELLELVDQIELNPYMKHFLKWTVDEIILKKNIQAILDDGKIVDYQGIKKRFEKIDILESSNRYLISEVVTVLSHFMINSIQNVVDNWKRDKNISHLNFYKMLELHEIDTNSPNKHVNNLSLIFLKNKGMELSTFDCLTDTGNIAYEDDNISSYLVGLNADEYEGTDVVPLPFNNYNYNPEDILKERTSDLEPSERNNILNTFRSNEKVVSLYSQLIQCLEKAAKENPLINQAVASSMQNSEEEFTQICTDNSKQKELFESIQIQFNESLFEISEINKTAISEVIDNLIQFESAYDQLEPEILSKYKGPKELDVIRGISKDQLTELIIFLDTKLEQQDIKPIEPVLEHYQHYQHYQQHQTKDKPIELQGTNEPSFINFEGAIVDKNVLEFESVQKILEKLNTQLILASKVAFHNNSDSILDTFLAILKNPSLANKQIFLPRNKVKKFTSDSTNGINKGDIEVDLNAKDRIFLREEEGLIKVIYLGNPDYHK